MKRKWIGLAHVLPRKGKLILGKGIGAHVQVLAFANSESDFKSKVKAAVISIGYRLESLQNIDELETRLSGGQTHPDIVQIGEELSADDPILFSVFHTYSKE